jgi:hypothetical protein
MVQMARWPFMVPPWRYLMRAVKGCLRSFFARFVVP